MSSHKPDVSVIIPTYNSSPTLEMSLETVLNQDFKNFEAIVIGDGCTDDSESKILSFRDKRLHWTNLPENSGTPSAPRNEGLHLARGEFIAYLGHDDLWFPWHLSGLIDSIQKSGAQFVYSLGANIGPEGVVSVFSLPKRLTWRHSGLSPSNWLHHKNLINDIGHWPLNTKVSDDQEFLRRIWKHKIRIEFNKQLSVIKFPSTFFQIYSRTKDFPQKSFLDSMTQDAAGLRTKMLQEYTSALSSRFNGFQRGPVVIKSFTDLIRFTVNLYGRNRWPMQSLLYRRYRRKSGLPPNGPH